jgi:3-hydroxyacyl-CoA dehydrogenase/enoyl-CoA hydratase/3-hydroxybutyryl-CoA epimerase
MATRSASHPPVARAVVIGAGTMGAAIAYLLATAGIDVALVDRVPAASAQGLQRSRALVADGVARGLRSAAAGAAVSARIAVADDLAGAAAGGADVLIEAVFEDPALKARLLGEAERALPADALLCSNTSSLPIAELGADLAAPDRLVGLHFFYPAEKTRLVEVVRGARSSAASVARAVALGERLGKTAIVVADRRGFFAGRVFAALLYEAIAMLREGVDAASVEAACGEAGYRLGALALADELGLQLLRSVRRQYAAAALAAGDQWQPGPAEPLIDELLDVHGRAGRATGAGFYDYAGGVRGGLWPGLTRLACVAAAKPGGTPPSPGELAERLLFVQSIEALRCLDEGVVASPADADVASLLGIGFPQWTGGVLSYVERYDGGAAGFAGRARELADAHGERFAPPAGAR